jgi:ankyrin repeat protein
MLEELPETLDETYERILKDINKANRAHAHRLLQCLTVAVRPLRVAELAEVLAVDFGIVSHGGTSKLNPAWRWEDQQHAVLSTCSSLISVVDEDGSQVVQFSHFSVKEFLTSSRLADSSSDVSRFHILFEPAHTILAKACLGVLLRLDELVDRHNVENKFPLARYAAEHWVDHAQLENVRSDIREGMRYLFDPDKPYFTAWLRVHDIDSRLPDRSTLYYFGKLDKGLNAMTPLYYAAFCGFYDLAEQLIMKHPQQVNANCGRCVSPLGAALAREHLDVAQLLYDHRADVDVRGMLRLTQLSAPNQGHREIVEWLLSHGVDPNIPGDTDVFTPLHMAAWFGQVEVSRILLQHKVDQNALDKHGQTPLHLASQQGHIDVARLLLEHGVDVNAQDNHRSTALHLALRHKPIDIARLLLEHGVDVNIQDDVGQTALHKAASIGKVEILHILLRHKANQNAVDNDGRTPLHLASRLGNIDIARSLLEHGADVSAQDNKRSTALHLASEKSKLEVARLLLEYGADVEVEDDSGRTPLVVASGEVRDEITKLLSDHLILKSRST